MRTARGEIIGHALQRVGNTTATLVQAARYRLNRILQDLYQGADWPFLWKVSELEILPNGVVPLPEFFVKPEDIESLQLISLEGQPFVATVQEVDHRTFYGQHPSLSLEAAMPLIWTLDYSVPVGFVWPRPNQRCAATLRYKWLPPDFPLEDAAIYDADIPIFPWDTVLSDLVFEWAQSYEVDPRRAEQIAINAQQIMQTRGASFPERSYSSFVPLDPLIFSTPWRGN
jgi:hypothetical protein